MVTEQAFLQQRKYHLKLNLTKIKGGQVGW